MPNTNISWPAIGRRMQIARHALGITEQGAAAAWDVTLRTYRKWEAGAPQRGTFNVVCFAKKYDVSLDWLIVGDATRLRRHLRRTRKARWLSCP
jgi:hypothetical protein